MSLSHEFDAAVRETSAGGLVLDDVARPRAAVLIGRTNRRGRLEWVLPKGHVEPGESYAQTAEREVFEETGLRATTVMSLGTLEYWFSTDGRRIHKTVHHFVMQHQGGTMSTADREVTRVAWVSLGALAARLRYASERALVSQLEAVLAGEPATVFQPGSTTEAEPSAEGASTSPGTAP